MSRDDGAQSAHDANGNREGVGNVANPDPAVPADWVVHPDDTEYDVQEVDGGIEVSNSTFDLPDL